MPVKRKILKIDTPRAHHGFLGAGHTARAVIQSSYAESDPFIMLMDDMLDKRDEKPVGGPHPHAGFETVTLMIEGEMGDDIHTMKSGDFQMMTAGSGIIHTETIQKQTKMRLLQLWLVLPKADRWATPRVQNLSVADVPTASENGLNVKLYSGSFAGITSPVSNYVPIIIADIRLEENAATIQTIPSSFTTFLYVLEGSLKVGNDDKSIHQNGVGWLDKYEDNTQSELQLTAGTSGARLILYSAQPQGDLIISHGPFIGDNQDDIARLYKEYRQGKMKDISSVAASQQEA